MVSQKKRQKIQLEADDYVKGIVHSDISVLSQAITIIESALHEHLELSNYIIDNCLEKSGNSVRVGITGVPGVGKSSFIEMLGLHLVNDLGRKVAVLAVDPTSHVSRGSILGDKVRMEQLSRHPDAFIRPSPTSGSMGGVARKTRETIILCEAAGFDTIIIETVGVGQSEISVHSMVDFFLLLMLARAGDSLQGIKRGVVEMADALAITKADGDNIKNAEIAMKEYRNALRLFPPKDSGWDPRVYKCSSLTGEGIMEIWETVLEYFDKAKNSGYLIKNRQEQAKYWMHETVLANLKDGFYNNPGVRAVINKLEQKVIKGDISSFTAAKKLIDIYLGRTN